MPEPVVGPVPTSAPDQARYQAGAALMAVIDELDARYPERNCVLQQAVLALIAREHLLVFGPPGTGKSEIAAGLMRRLVDATGRPSLYSRQIVETTVQTDLVGPVDFKTLTETGRTVYHLDEGILNAEHAVLDEVFDGRDLLLRSILSVLNERELALGPVVHRARLQTAILTTNRYLSEVLNARPETLLAFTDRIAFACFIPKGFASPASREAVLRLAAEPPTAAPKAAPIAGLDLLRQAAREVRVPEDTRVALAALVDVFGKMLRDATAERKGYAPTCFLSPRTLAKSIGVLRAGVVVDRYLEGRDRPLSATVDDLARLRWMFALGGPLAEDSARVLQTTTDPKEKWQLENLRLEAAAFERALGVVVSDSQRKKESESKAIGLPELRERVGHLAPGSAAEVALLIFNARAQTQSEVLRSELDEMARAAALSFAVGARSGTLPDVPLGELTSRLKACLALARILEGQPADAKVGTEIARRGAAEAFAGLSGIGGAEQGRELDAKLDETLGDLGERAQGLDRQISEIETLGRQLEVLSALGPAGRVQAMAQETRRKVAWGLRRRAMLLMGGSAREAQGWKALGEASRRLEELDARVEHLCPGEGKVRSHVLGTRAGLLLAGELEAVPGTRLTDRRAGDFDFTLKVRQGIGRLDQLKVERGRSLKLCRPVIEARLTAAYQSLRSLPAPPEKPHEQGYEELLRGCTAHEDRRALYELVKLTHLESNPLVAQLAIRLVEVDLHELSLQVNYLARWLDDVTAGVPEPAELKSREEADDAWARVSATRFFAVGWRDRDLASLHGRLTQLAALPSIAEEARRTLGSLEAVASTADSFGRALLERRAELAAA